MEIVNNSDIAFRNESNITFMNYIEENYYSIKRKLKRVHNGYKEVLFDEDVFQDTILKVNESLKDKQFTKEVYEKYFCGSFKRNLLREKLYHFNLFNSIISLLVKKRKWGEPHFLKYYFFSNMRFRN